MLSHFRRKLLVYLHIVIHNIDNRRFKELLDSLCNNRTHIVLLLHIRNHFLKQSVVIGQLEVPVHNVLHYGSFSCNGALGVDKVNGIVLMTQIALVRIALFRLTALNGAFSHHLSAVEEHSCLFVIELSGGYFFQVTHFIKLPDKCVGNLVMPLCSFSQTRCTEKVKAYVIIRKGFLLSLVIAAYIVLYIALEALLASLSVALGNGRAVAVSTRNEDNIILAYPVSQETCIYISKYKHTAHVSEMERFISIGHTACYNSSFRELRTVVPAYSIFLFIHIFILVSHSQFLRILLKFKQYIYFTTTADKLQDFSQKNRSAHFCTERSAFLELLIYNFHGITGNEKLLVGGNYPYLNLAVVGGNTLQLASC